MILLGEGCVAQTLKYIFPKHCTMGAVANKQSSAEITTKETQLKKIHPREPYEIPS